MAEDTSAVKCIRKSEFYEKEVKNENIKETSTDVKENVIENSVKFEEIKKENVCDTARQKEGKDNEVNEKDERKDLKLLTVVAEDDESRYIKMTAEEIFIEGKECFKNKNFEKAADLLSRATEKKVNESSSLTEGEGDLCLFYLWYADALLTKEENNNSLFDHEAENKLSSVPTDKNLAEEEQEKEEEQEDNEELTSEQCDGDVSDEQLAFEIFELARKSYRMKIALEKQKNLTKKKNSEQEKCHEGVAIEDTKDEKTKLKEEEMLVNQDYLNDLSYIHMRLGDIQLLNDFFSEAADEYREAYEIRKRNVDRFGIHNLISPAISYAQATLFSGKKREALVLFEEALELVKQELSTYEEKEKDEKYKNLLESEEDLDIQLKELKTKITEEESSGNIVEGVKGSQFDIQGSMIKTTSTFDKPRLPQNSCVKKITIVSSKKTEGTEEHTDDAQKDEHGGHFGTPKKRKIDLTNLMQNDKNENSSVSCSTPCPTTAFSNVHKHQDAQNSSFAPKSS